MEKEIMSTTKFILLSLIPLEFSLFVYWLGGGEFYRHNALAITFVIGVFWSLLTAFSLASVYKENDD
jgi:membrane protein YdbS with pleckstrin-like domain